MARFLREQGSVAAKVIGAAYAAQLPTIAKAAGDEDEDTNAENAAAFAALSEADRQAKLDQVLDAYNFSQWGFLSAHLEDEIETSAKAGTESALEQMLAADYGLRGTIVAHADVDSFFNRMNESASNYAHDRSAEMVGKKWVEGMLIDNPDPKWAITDSTRDWLRDAIEKAFTEGMSPAQLAKDIQSSDAFSKSRAKMIAQTEIQTANVQSHARVATAGGATHKRSFLSADHDQDDFCDDAADEGEVPIGHDYGGMFGPPYHPRCYCSISFYVRKPKSDTLSS